MLGMDALVVGLSSTVISDRVKAVSSNDAKWKQLAESKLVFLSKNTPPSFAIREKIKFFCDLTEITVETLTADLPVVQQKDGIGQ